MGFKEVSEELDKLQKEVKCLEHTVSDMRYGHDGEKMEDAVRGMRVLLVIFFVIGFLLGALVL